MGGEILSIETAKRIKELENENKKLKIELQDTKEHLGEYLFEKDQIIARAKEYNKHLMRDAKYHLNLGHLRKMKKILEGEE